MLANAHSFNHSFIESWESEYVGNVLRLFPAVQHLVSRHKQNSLPATYSFLCRTYFKSPLTCVSSTLIPSLPVETLFISTNLFLWENCTPRNNFKCQQRTTLEMRVESDVNHFMRTQGAMRDAVDLSTYESSMKYMVYNRPTT